MDEDSQFTCQVQSHMQQLKSSASMACVLGTEENDELLLGSVSQNSNNDETLHLPPQMHTGCKMNLSNSFDCMLKSGRTSDMTGDLFEQTNMKNYSQMDAHEKWTYMYSKLVHDLKSILTPELVPEVHLKVSCCAHQKQRFIPKLSMILDL